MPSATSRTGRWAGCFQDKVLDQLARNGGWMTCSQLVVVFQHQVSPEKAIRTFHGWARYLSWRPGGNHQTTDSQVAMGVRRLVLHALANLANQRRVEKEGAYKTARWRAASAAADVQDTAG